MQYDFNQPIDRWDNFAAKYDELEQRYGRRDLIPMWIADMDLRTAQPICWSSPPMSHVIDTLAAVEAAATQVHMATSLPILALM